MKCQLPEIWAFKKLTRPIGCGNTIRPIYTMWQISVRRSTRA